jgi:glycosyltransferase involved in cell wall biosynthesis
MRAHPYGFNFFAHIGGNFGLAVAARSTLAWLLSQRQLVCVRDASTGDERFRQDHTYDALVTHRPWGLPYGVNLFHLNPPQLDLCLALEWQFLPIEWRMNVAVPFWELPSLPPLWRGMLAAMDLVLAPTRFVQEIVESNIPGARTLHFPIVIPKPAPAQPARARFGLPEQGLVFLSAFDVASDIHRKNPWAAIEAFQRAFTAQERVHLVVKLSNSGSVPEAQPLVERLRQVAASDRRVVLIDQHLPQPDLYCLYASCDVLVSLHRAEGLGLIPMEMMSLGKPVIATAWSGSMDFTNPDNSCLVDYDMVPVQGACAAYQQESARATVLWADPRMETAVAWMRRLQAEPDLRARIGQQAAQDMQHRAEADRSGTLADIRRVLFSPETQAGHPARARWLFQHRVERLARSFCHSPMGFLRRGGDMLRKAVAPSGNGCSQGGRGPMLS